MAPAVSTFEQFAKFATDAYGLERTLRLFQALTQLLIAVPLFRLLLFSLLFPPGSHLHQTLTPDLLALLRRRLSSLRQPFRTFRFLPTLASAWSVWSADPPSPSPPSSLSPPTQDGIGKASGGDGSVLWTAKHVERWADFAAKSFNGMYMLLESLTFVESALAVPGLSVWGEAGVVELAMDGQKFWFVSLVCAVVAGVARLRAAAAADAGSGVKKVRSGVVLRRVVADCMDLAVPGSVVGWVNLGPGAVGLLMLGSTVLTGMEVWERCGMEVAAEKAAAGMKR